MSMLTDGSSSGQAGGPVDFPAVVPDLYPPSDRPIPIDVFIARVLKLYEPPLRAEKTYGKMRQVMRELAALPGVRSTADLNTQMVQRFIASRPEKEHPNTTYSMVGYLRAVCNIAAAEGYIRISPFAVRKQWVRRVTPKAPRVHSRAQIARVLAEMDGDVKHRTGWGKWRAMRLRALFATVAYTGMRRNEAFYLLTRDIDFEAGMILLVARGRSRLKTDAAAQPVPMPGALAEILAEWLPHAASVWAFPNAEHSGPWIGGSPGHRPLDRLKALGKRAGVPGLTFASLRHSWATHAEYWGLSDAQIQRVLRHTNTRTQWHYRHAETNNLREIVRAINFDPADADGRGREARP